MLYQEIARTVDAYHRCQETGNTEWEAKHGEKLAEYADMLPSGGGIDCGTKIDVERSTGEKLVLVVSFHHMDEGGMYDGWTEHEIIVRPSLMFGFAMRISGRNRNGIKEYLGEVYESALRCEQAVNAE